MIKIADITEENFEAIIKMKRPENEHYVASNSVSLAQAWLYRSNNDVFPYAICNDGTPVGFLLLEDDLEDRELWIWRIMFPVENENKGFAQETVKLIIQFGKENKTKYDAIYLDCGKDNTKALHVYKKCGFKETGIIENDSIQLKYEL